MINRVDDDKRISVTNDYGEEIKAGTFAGLIRKWIKEYNEGNADDMSVRILAERLKIGYEVFRKIINRNKPTQKRDLIFVIGLLLGRREIDDYNEMFHLYSMPSPDWEEPREGFILEEIVNKDITIQKLNRALQENGFNGLDIHDWRGSSREKDVEKNASLGEYIILGRKTRTLIDDVIYGDRYNSLATRYAPDEYNTIGYMFLEHAKSKKRVLLTSSDHNMSAEIDGETVLPRIFKTMGETGEFNPYFTKLNSLVRKEKIRYYSVLNDTRNYQKRASARLIDDVIWAFAEQFNYELPALEEYYLVTYSGGKYRYHVYKESSFMRWYLSDKKYDRYYGKYNLRPEKTYSSLDEMEAIIDNKKADAQERNLVRVRLRHFKALRQDVDEIYQGLKSRTVYIQNLDYIYDNPDDTLRYYRIDGKEWFDCEIDELDIIRPSCDAKLCELPDGGVVEIKLEDVYKAFEYGFENIDDIVRIKAKYGSIDAVLP